MDVGTIAELESETARLEKAKADMKTALEEKGETVPAEESISTYAQHISNISGNEQNVLVNADFQNFLTFSEGETFWGFGPRGIFAPGWEKGGNTSVEVVPGGLKVGFQSERGLDVCFSQKFKPEFRVNERSKKVKVEIVINGKLYTSELSGGPNEASGVVYAITEENLRIGLYPGSLDIWPIENSAAGFYKIINNIRVIPVAGMDYYIDPDLNRLQSLGYNPETATEQMTQPVGVKDGKFFTQKSVDDSGIYEDKAWSSEYADSRYLRALRYEKMPYVECYPAQHTDLEVQTYVNLPEGQTVSEISIFQGGLNLLKMPEVEGGVLNEDGTLTVTTKDKPVRLVADLRGVVGRGTYNMLNVSGSTVRLVNSPEETGGVSIRPGYARTIRLTTATVYVVWDEQSPNTVVTYQTQLVIGDKPISPIPYFGGTYTQKLPKPVQGGFFNWNTGLLRIYRPVKEDIQLPVSHSIKPGPDKNIFKAVGQSTVIIRGLGYVDRIDDGRVSSDMTWSSQNTVEKFCLPFSNKEPVVACSPVEGYPYTTVKSHLVPQQSGSGDPSPENVRPFVPYEKAELTRCGKNLVSVESSAEADRAEASPVANGTRITKTVGTEYAACGFPVYLKAGTEYYVNCEFNLSSPSALPAIGIFTDEVAFVKWLYVDGRWVNNSFKLAKEGRYLIRLYPGQTAAGVIGDYCDFTNLTVSAGQASYAPYQGETYTAPLPAETYGGEVDWLNGTLAPGDWQFVTITGRDDQSWITSDSVDYGAYYDGPDTIANGVGFSSVSKYGSGFVYHPKYEDHFIWLNRELFGPDPGLDEFKKKVRDLGGIQVAFQITEKLTDPPTPITPSATPTAIPGVNTLYSVGGDTTVEGREDPLATIANQQAQIDELKKAILATGGNV